MLFAFDVDTRFSDNGDGIIVTSAEQAMQAIIALETLKDECSITQAQIVAHVARNELYRGHSDPKAAADLRGFLKACDLCATSASLMYSLGAIIIPFCDDNDIEINHLLIGKVFPRTIPAISALRKVITKRGCPDRVREIIRFVESASSRQVVRKQYQPCQKLLADGQVSVDNGIITMSVIPRRGVTPEDVIQKLCLYFNLNGGQR